MSLLSASPYRIIFKDGSLELCFARSPANLAQRIEWVAGAGVDSVEPVAEITTQPQANQSPTTFELKQKEHIEMLQKLAAEDLPNYDCPHKSEILRARAELSKDVLNARK